MPSVIPQSVPNSNPMASNASRGIGATPQAKSLDSIYRGPSGVPQHIQALNRRLEAVPSSNFSPLPSRPTNTAPDAFKDIGILYPERNPNTVPTAAPKATVPSSAPKSTAPGGLGLGAAGAAAAAGLAIGQGVGAGAAIGSSAGSLGGAILGGTVGPVGAAVGSVVGGFVGGLIGGLVDQQFNPTMSPSGQGQGYPFPVIAPATFQSDALYRIDIPYSVTTKNGGSVSNAMISTQSGGDELGVRIAAALRIANDENQFTKSQALGVTIVLLRPGTTPAPNPLPTTAPVDNPFPMKSPTDIEGNPIPAPKMAPARSPQARPGSSPQARPGSSPLPRPGNAPQAQPNPITSPNFQPNQYLGFRPTPGTTPTPAPTFFPGFAPHLSPVTPVSQARPTPGNCCPTTASPPIKKVKVAIKVFDRCQFNPITKTIDALFKFSDVTALEGTESQISLLHDRIYELEALQCDPKKDATLSIPDWWAVRLGADRPQLSIVYADINAEGKIGKSRWTLNVPHYKGVANVFPDVTPYTKGQYYAYATLKDNSKINVHADSQSEAERVCKQLLMLVLNKFLGDDVQINYGFRKGQKLATVKVIPVSAQYFSKGQLNLIPDWVAYPK